MQHNTKQFQYVLPLHSRHGVIMKTCAFIDPNVGEITWCVANKTISGEWVINQFITDLFPGEVHKIRSVAYKGDALLNYGEAVNLLAEYEYNGRNSGMIDMTDDHPVTRHIPSYRYVAHGDGIIFDDDGFPHPTHEGNVITRGTFSSDEMIAVLNAVHEAALKPLGTGSDFSVAFTQAHQPAQERLQAQGQLKSLEGINHFIQSVLDSCLSFSNAKRVSYYLSQRLFSRMYRNSLYIDDIYWEHDKSGKDIKQAYDVLEKNKNTLSPELVKEGKDILYVLSIMLSSQIIYTTCTSCELQELNTRKMHEIAEVKERREVILRSERNMLTKHVKEYGSRKMSRKELDRYVDRTIADAISERFPERMQEVKEIAVAFMVKLELFTKTPQQEATQQPKLPAPKVT